MPESWPQLGLMRGTPPPPERLVTSDNWIEGPFNRWGFLHVRELARTALIPRGGGPVLELPYDLQDLDSLPVPFEGATLPLADAVVQGYTDGICVVHRGRVIPVGDEHLLRGRQLLGEGLLGGLQIPGQPALLVTATQTRRAGLRRVSAQPDDAAGNVHRPDRRVGQAAGQPLPRAQPGVVLSAHFSPFPAAFAWPCSDTSRL